MKYLLNILHYLIILTGLKIALSITSRGQIFSIKHIDIIKQHYLFVGSVEQTHMKKTQQFHKLVMEKYCFYQHV